MLWLPWDTKPVCACPLPLLLEGGLRPPTLVVAVEGWEWVWLSEMGRCGKRNAENGVRERWSEGWR